MKEISGATEDVIESLAPSSLVDKYERWKTSERKVRQLVRKEKTDWREQMIEEVGRSNVEGSQNVYQAIKE